MKTKNLINLISVPSIVVLLFGSSADAVFAQQNLIVNGSFETGPPGEKSFPGWDQIGPASDNSDYGVATSTTSPDVAEQGTNYAYFHGAPTDSSQDCLGQTVSLTVGAQYTISFYMGTDGTTLGSGAAMWVAIGTSFGLDYSQDLSLAAYFPNSSNALPYQKFTSTITATNSYEILSFHGIDASSSILVDNVSMTLVVPPGPQLSVKPAPTNTLLFTWISATNGYRLQTNSLLGTTNWGTLTNAPMTAGSSNQIILPMPAGKLFYRLTLP
jgi:hypothetical protein